MIVTTTCMYVYAGRHGPHAQDARENDMLVKAQEKEREHAEQKAQLPIVSVLYVNQDVLLCSVLLVSSLLSLLSLLLSLLLLLLLLVVVVVVVVVLFLFALLLVLFQRLSSCHSAPSWTRTSRATSTILHYTILYYTILYNTIQYYPLLHYTILYYTMI